MLSKSNGTNRDQLEMVSLDEMVPEDYLVRKLEKAIDFSFIYCRGSVLGPWAAPGGARVYRLYSRQANFFSRSSFT